MALGSLESRDFDRYLNLSERSAHDSVIACNEAFVAAMNREIARGKVKARFGTFVDLTPSSARHIYGTQPHSPCGSPAAMCFDSGGSYGGAEAMK